MKLPVAIAIEIAILDHVDVSNDVKLPFLTTRCQ